MATQGGIWQAVALGCAGVRAGADALELDPQLPPGWRRLSLRISYQGTPLILSLTPDEIVIEARTAAIAVRIGDPSRPRSWPARRCASRSAPTAGTPRPEAARPRARFTDP